MTQEHKKFLLQDLSARLPYRPKIKIGKCYDYTLAGIDLSKKQPIIVELDGNRIEVSCENVQPVLRPRSSMTEEEKRHVCKMTCLSTYDNGVVYDIPYDVYTPYYVMEDCLNYLRSIHIDYSGLIDMGLALEAPEGIYNINE